MDGKFSLDQAGQYSYAQTPKPMVDFAKLDVLKPQGVRDYIKEGNFGGDFQKDDETMLALWQVGVEETRAAMEGLW